MKKYIWVLCLACNLLACKTNNTMKIHAFRLKPGEDLKQRLEQFVAEHNIEAAWMISCVGSLTNYSIRFANQPESSTGAGHFEIVSLTGTLSKNGSHLHIAISDSLGQTIGGHLMDGNSIYTTAEIVIGSTDALSFLRVHDGSTPWKELEVQHLKEH